MYRSGLRILLRAFLATALLAALLPAYGFQTPKRGRKYVAPPPTARIEVSVIRESNGKPVSNAAVIFHPMEGEKDKGNMELKTNEEGKALIDVLNVGSVVRLQVIADGFQTFGDDYKIEGAEKQIVVKLKRPGEQYSVYKSHPEQGQESPTPQKSPETTTAPSTAPKQ